MRLPEKVAKNSYMRLVLAAKEGRGIRFDADQVHHLVRDNAIFQAAASLCENHGLRLDPNSLEITAL